MELLAGFLLGLLGSFHCVGMCGPLVLSLPVSRRFIPGRVLYNIGRVLTYGFFGLIFGLAGSGLNLAGLQQIISVSLGILIIITAIAPEKYKTRFMRLTGFEKIILVFKKSISAYYKSNKLSGNLAIGILNGFLPCGFVYMALTGALILGSISSSLFMMMFGLGTIPAMFAVSAAGRIASANFRNKLKRYIPALAVVIAVLFILRGLNLGIPYVSPRLENPVPATEKTICH